MSSHDVLGVSPKASKEEIRKAYHKLSMIYHPDRPNGDVSKFIKIKDAYDKLMTFDPNKTHNIHYESTGESVECISIWHMGGNIEHTYVLDHMMLARVIINGKIHHTWTIPNNEWMVTLTVPKRTLLACKYNYAIHFTSKIGTGYVFNYSFNDPRSFIQKVIDYFIY